MLKYTKYLLLILFLWNCIFIFEANAATINANSISREDVQAAINSASQGDIVIVPEGSRTWTNNVEMNVGITLQGAGIDRTVITNGRTGYNQALIRIDGTEGDPIVRVTGFTLQGSGYTNNHAYGIIVNGTSKNFRIDHCKFTGGGSHTIAVWGHTYGVIDHCTFIDASAEVIVVFDKVDGSDSWAVNIDNILGTKNAVFVEDCNFTATGDHHGMHVHSICSNCGGRYVFRYNEVSSPVSLNCVHIDVHGYCFQSNRGARHYEIYNNTIEIEGSSSNWVAMNIRGGDGVIYDNTFKGNWWYANVHIQNYRSFQNCSATNPTNCYDGEGYPCKDQIRKLYIWGNNANGGPIKVVVKNRGQNRNHIQQNRDFFLTQKPGYSPYTYPHPLNTGTPSTPSGLQREEIGGGTGDGSTPAGLQREQVGK